MEIKKSKTYEILDLINWQENSELIINPKYQRNPVWDNNAKSFLIDTVLRDFPMPPLFYRQSFNLKDRKTKREVIDGQQRTRAILGFYNNEFPVLKRHNSEYGGMFYKDLPDEAKERFLKYSVFVDTISETDDSIIYDIFARMNSNAANVNKQEIRNAKYWGLFKTYVYDTASKIRDYFIKFETFTSKGFARMQDMEYISSLFILAISGCTAESSSQIDKYYRDFNDSFLDASKIQSAVVDAFVELDNLADYVDTGCVILSNKNYMYDFIGLTFVSKGLIQVKTLKPFSFPSHNTLAARICELDYCLKQIKPKNADRQSADPTVLKYERDHKVHSNSKGSREDRIEFLYRYLIQNERN